MSDTLRPWLADAVAQYRRVHGRNLTFTKKGRLLQVIQFNNYRNTSLPEERQNDVYAWAHDKAYEVLVRFDAQAINAFEEKHESFTSYRYGLFQILEYKFVLGTNYVAEEPRAANRTRTFADLPNPRMFHLHITKFNYISSKGEGNFASRTRKFEELTRNWRIDIEADEEKKRGLVLQVTASQTHAHDAPPSLAEIQAVADVLRSKGVNNSSTGRSLEKHGSPQILNPKNMLRIPPELLSTLRSPPVQASDIANQKVTPERSPVTHIPRLLEILPSTPPPPSSSGSLSLTSISGMKTTVTKSRSLTDMALEPDPGDTPRPVQHAAVEVPKTNQTPTTLKAGAQPKALSPSFGVHSPAMKRKSAANVHTNASVQASVDLLGSQPLPKDGQEIEPNDRSGDHAKQTSTSNPAKRKKKAEPLPRFALDSPDEEDLNDIVATPLKDHSESRVSMLVDVDFIKNVASSPQNGAVGATSAQTEMPVLASRSFYGVSKRLFRSQSPPVHSAPSDAPARQEQSPNGARPRKMARVFGDQDRNSVRSGSSFSGESSDGFEFVSFAQDFSENTSRVDVKLKAVDTPVLVTLKDNEPTLLDISSHAERLSNNEQPAPASRSTSAEATSAFQLKTISQQDLDALLSRLNTSLRKKARSTSIVSSRSAQVNSATTRSSPSKATAHTESDRPPVVKYRKIPSIEQKPAVAPPSPKHKALKKRDVLPRRASLKGQANSAATHLLPSSSSSPVIGSVILSDHASASRKARVSDVVKPLSRSLSGSARTGQQSEARQAIAAIMGDIKMYLESKGLTRRQSIDLWYCCSGDLDVACQIADNNLSIIKSFHGDLSFNGPDRSGSDNDMSRSVRNAYRRCWTLEDDQAVEDPNPLIFQIARKLQEIESRRGKGSIASRKRFLTENPLAKKLARKVRYPYDYDES